MIIFKDLGTFFLFFLFLLSMSLLNLLDLGFKLFIFKEEIWLLDEVDQLNTLISLLLQHGFNKLLTFVGYANLRVKL